MPPWPKVNSDLEQSSRPSLSMPWVHCMSIPSGRQRMLSLCVNAAFLICCSPYTCPRRRHSCCRLVLPFFSTFSSPLIMVGNDDDVIFLAVFRGTEREWESESAQEKSSTSTIWFFFFLCGPFCRYKCQRCGETLIWCSYVCPRIIIWHVFV